MKAFRKALLITIVVITLLLSLASCRLERGIFGDLFGKQTTIEEIRNNLVDNTIYDVYIENPENDRYEDDIEKRFGIELDGDVVSLLSAFVPSDRTYLAAIEFEETEDAKTLENALAQFSYSYERAGKIVLIGASIDIALGR